MISLDPTCRLLSLMWFVVATSVGVWAGTVGGSQDIDVELELKQLIEKEHSEKEKLLTDEAIWKDDLDRLRDVRKQMARNVLELELKRGRLELQVKHLDDIVLVERKKEESNSDALNDIYDFSKLTAEEMSIYSREQPVGLLALESNKTFISRVIESNDVAASYVVRLVELVGQIHEESSSVVLMNETVRGPDGIQKEVEVIQVGHIGSYYLTQQNNRVGIALDSPRDASGFRWNESMLSATESAQIIEAVEMLRDRNPVSVELPVDVTTILTEIDLAGRMGLRQWFLFGGLVMYPLAGVAVLAIAMVGQRFWVLNREGRGGSSIARTAIKMCREGQFDQAAEKLKQSRGVVPRTLHACLSHRDQGQHAMEDRIQEQLLYEMPRLQRFLRGIAVLGAVAPLLGLLGTVTGIIQTFGVIKSYSDTDPSMLAGGISEALVTTASGLVIAIPILLFHGLLRGWVERIISDAEKHAATVLNFLLADKR